MQIRRLAWSDLDALLDLYGHLHEADGPLPAREAVETVWSELLASAGHRYYGVFVGDRLVCSCNLTIIPNLTRSCRPYGVIENVVTHIDFRRRGYGHGVLAQALSEAWSEGCYKVMLQTGRKDEATFQFYEGAGFSRNEKQAFVARPAA